MFVMYGDNVLQKARGMEQKVIMSNVVGRLIENEIFASSAGTESQFEMSERLQGEYLEVRAPSWFPPVQSTSVQLHWLIFRNAGKNCSDSRQLEKCLKSSKAASTQLSSFSSSLLVSCYVWRYCLQK